MRHLTLFAALLAGGLSFAAEPTKADLEKKVKDLKESLAKAGKELEPLKKDKDIGAQVTKLLDAKTKASEAWLKSYELQALPNYTAAVEKQDKVWQDTHAKKLKEAIAAREAIEKISAEKAKQFDKAYEPYEEAQKALTEAQAALIAFKTGK